ncbi:putative Phytocyanin domain, cupredoxin [Helianthus annuus]|nr:putative Phytocyanin domain, cupredoxin [Helianthus annuus]
MASLRLTFAMVTTIVVACMYFPTTLAATGYVVGGANGWSMPQKPNHYENWTKGKRFIKGDAFFWVFKEGQHFVVEVPSKEAYDACNTTASTEVDDTGQLIRYLIDVKIHYYVCKYHCSKGMKVIIGIKAS